MSAHRKGEKYGTEFFRIMAGYGMKNGNLAVLCLIFKEQRKARELVAANDPRGIALALSLRATLG